MTRCPLRPPVAVPTLLRGAATTAAIALISAAAWAQLPVREFPKNALRGELVVTQPPLVTLNGQPHTLSPGARIRGADNMLVMSGALIGQPVLVNYQLDPQGQLREVWILNAQEARERRPRTEASINRTTLGDAPPPQDDGKTPYNQLPGFPKQ